LTFLSSFYLMLLSTCILLCANKHGWMDGSSPVYHSWQFYDDSRSRFARHVAQWQTSHVTNMMTKQTLGTKNSISCKKTRSSAVADRPRVLQKQYLVGTCCQAEVRRHELDKSRKSLSISGPSLFHSFTSGSKPTFSTNPSHLNRLLVPSGLPSRIMGLDWTSSSSSSFYLFHSHNAVK